MELNLNIMDFIIYIIGVFLTLMINLYSFDTNGSIKNAVESDKIIFLTFLILIPMMSWIGLVIMLLILGKDDNF